MWLRSSSIPLDEHGSKIRKVIRCRPTVSNEIILATRQEFFYTRVLSSRKKYNWHCVIAFLINAALLNVYFTLQYHLFFRKETYFFEVTISVNMIFGCLYIHFLVEKGTINSVSTQLYIQIIVGRLTFLCKS